MELVRKVSSDLQATILARLKLFAEWIRSFRETSLSAMFKETIASNLEGADKIEHLTTLPLTARVCEIRCSERL